MLEREGASLQSGSAFPQAAISAIVRRDVAHESGRAQQQAGRGHAGSITGLQERTGLVVPADLPCSPILLLKTGRLETAQLCDSAQSPHGVKRGQPARRGPSSPLDLTPREAPNERPQGPSTAAAPPAAPRTRPRPPDLMERPQTTDGAV